jgi:hypothetical protein
MRASSSALALSYPTWFKRSEFAYDVPGFDRLPESVQRELYARWLLHDLMEYLDVDQFQGVILDEHGCEHLLLIAVLPIGIFNRLAEFDADGDPDLEDQCEDEGGACEDEGGECDDQGEEDHRDNPADHGFPGALFGVNVGYGPNHNPHKVPAKDINAAQLAGA